MTNRSTRNKVLYISLFIVMSCISYIMIPKIQKSFKWSRLYATLFTGIIMAIILASVYKIEKSKKKQKDSFHFEVDGPRRCLGGPYMWDEKLANYCKQFTENDIEATTCAPGLYNGVPISFEYTSLSNANWENDMCKDCTKNGTWSCGTGPLPMGNLKSY